MTNALTLIFTMINSCFTWLFSDLSDGLSIGWIMVVVIIICLLLSYFLKGEE